jgi:hypothetical protein
MAHTALLLLVCASCKQTFTRYDAGLQYQIIHAGNGPTVQPGQTLKLRMRQSYNDSVLFNTTDSLPFYQLHDSTRLSKAAYTIFSKVGKGDSLIFRVLTDSVFKEDMPPFAKKGEWLETRVWVQDILGEKEDWRADMEREVEGKKAR